MAERAKLFDNDEPDLSKFAPQAPSSAPPLAEVRGVSTAGGFPSRDTSPIIPERHYYRTGRDTQFNTKVRADVKAAFIAIANEDNIPIGKVLENALAALVRERGRG